MSPAAKSSRESLRTGAGSSSRLPGDRDIPKMLAGMLTLVTEQLFDRPTPMPAARRGDEPHLAVHRTREGHHQPAQVCAERIEAGPARRRSMYEAPSSTGRRASSRTNRIRSRSARAASTMVDATRFASTR